MRIRTVSPRIFIVPVEPGTGLSSTFRPIVPITLLVLTEVLGKHGPGPVLFGHRERGTAECMVFGQAACGRRTFPEDCGGVLGYLDELGCDDSVEPDEIGKHLLCICILHTDEVISGKILMVLNVGLKSCESLGNQRTSSSSSLWSLRIYRKSKIHCVNLLLPGV
jgi:hypothetical protein